MAQSLSSGELRDVFELADLTEIGLLRIDDGLSVVAANAAAHAALDRQPNGLVGRTVMEAFVDHRLEELVAAAVAGGIGSYEIGQGDDPRLRIRLHPAGDGGAWVSIETVTQLRRLQRLRSEFMDDLSHELRTPLASIRLVTEMLLGELESLNVPDRVRERVATIDVESGHLAQMIDELLDLARMEHGTREVRHDQVLLPGLIETVVGRLRTYAERQRVHVEAQISRELPPIFGDEERLLTLLLNLLHNAIKFSLEGGVVTITADEHPESVVVSIVDRGVGIPEAAQARVFERFYKVDRARHRGQGGTGLGLTIAHDITNAHRGRIWLDSKVGRGSTFSVSLPLATSADRS